MIIFKLLLFSVLIFIVACYFNINNKYLSDEQNFISRLVSYLSNNAYQSSGIIRFKIDQDINNIDNYNFNNNQIAIFLQFTIQRIIFNPKVDIDAPNVYIQNITYKDQKRILSNYTHISILRSYDLLNKILDLNIVYIVSIKNNLGTTTKEISTLITNDIQNGNFMKYFSNISYSLYQINSFDNSTTMINAIANISNSTKLSYNDKDHKNSTWIPYNFNNAELAGIIIALMIVIMLLLSLMFYCTDMRCDSIFYCHIEYYNNKQTKVIPLEKEP